MRLLLVMAIFVNALLGADVSGKWDAQVDTNAGAGTPSFVLNQDGEKVTGSYTGALGEATVEGTVKGQTVEFSFHVSPAGEKVKVTYKGTVKSATAMGGTLTIEGLGEGTWTATKR